MGLEAATYITDLVSNNPLGTDSKAQGDNHIRLLKSVLKTQFPSLGSAAVTTTAAELNKLDGATATTAELNILDGVTSTTAELNILDGVTATAAEINLLAGVSSLANLVYPVGSIYESIVSTSPATLFGGSWLSFGAGRVLVGIDSSQSEFNSVAETGGSKTHTLTTNELPSHSHTVAAMALSSSSLNTTGSSQRSVSSSITSSSTGGGAAHNNLQPYIVVYRWRRTA
tara:strand:- start:10917 stop:11600 length:684 start_codon:yes stop_codon:yes gene_type:complete